MELNFIKSGDYYIPDIQLQNPNIHLGKWGLMRKSYLRIAFRRMRMDAPGYETMTFLRVFMGTGNFRCPFGIAAGFVMRRVVFAQAARVRCACAGLSLRRKGRRGQHGQHHAA